MKKGQILDGYVERVDFPNRGRVTAEGTKVLVKDVLEGQKIRFQITKNRSKGCEGRLLEVLEPSASEILPDCPHFGACGGCSLRQLPYQEQLKYKDKQLRRLLEPFFGDFEGVMPSPAVTGYRNKMEYTFGDGVKGGEMTLGLHKRGSFYDILTTENCRIADEDFGMILRCVLDTAKESGLPYFHRQTHIGYYRHLLLRKGYHTGELLICLETSSQIDPLTETKLMDRFKDRLCMLPLAGSIAGILHFVNDRVADVVQSERTKILYGKDYFHETLLGLTFRISPFSFFQNNSPGAEYLYEKACEYIGETKGCSVYDLYCGTGTITQILARSARAVTGVEIVEEAVLAARENARLNGIGNCSFIAGDVLKVLDELTEKPDLLVLDPPRDGVHPKALTKILQYGVDRIVYVSCKPTSLVRDLELFYANGYRIKRCSGVDLFPGTVNVETVCCLYRQKKDFILISGMRIPLS